MESLGLALVSGAVALVVGAVAAGVVLVLGARAAASARRPKAPSGHTAILTEGNRIVDATPAARAFLSALGGGGWSAERLYAHLNSEFPGFASAFGALEERRRAELTSEDRARTLDMRSEGRRRRFLLRDAEARTVTLDRTCQTALEDELEALRAIGDAVPHPVWQQRPGGQISWANEAYLTLMAERGRGDAATWPPAALFPLDEIVSRNGGRVQILDAEGDGETGWYDCHVRSLAAGMLITAVPADAQIRAEKSLREFVQTFSNTFAHLTVGLAVFNRQRRLMLFNPALTDLTHLPVDILLNQPTLRTFLDALRARRMIPEPKTVTSWRERVSAIERGSADGSLSEMWHLASNRTYRVSGRPQPDGAFALLIEDISDEIGLTRRFRDQIETGHAVLNAIDDAIAVFDRSGILTLSNAAYDELWGQSATEGMTHLTTAQALRTWHEASKPTPVWGDARAFLEQEAERSEWNDTVRLDDGRALHVTFSPLAGGASLVRFAERPPADPGRALTAPNDGQRSAPVTG